MRVFDPYIGRRIDEGLRDGLRVLIVGESHYAVHDPKMFTRCAVKSGGITESWPFFEHIRQTARGLSPLMSGPEFWTRVAFCNIVQRPMEGASDRPTKLDYDDGWLALRETIAEVKPDMMLVYSKEAWGNSSSGAGIIEIDAREGWNWPELKDTIYVYDRHVGALPTMGLNHPSRRTVSLEIWRVATEYFWSRREKIVEEFQSNLGLRKA